MQTMIETLRDQVLALRKPFLLYATNGGKASNSALPLSEAEVERFEKKHSISLPEEYRYFITLVGNGGDNLFRLGEMDNGWDFATWEEGDGFIGTLANTFPFTDSWNDLSGYLDYDEAKAENQDWLAAYEQQRSDFESRYFAPIDGAIPIAHLGCAMRLWLVVAGPEIGNIWHDDRANLSGITPLKSLKGERVTFLTWCKGWL